MTTSPPVIATYEREIRASVDRIWENVLDWEHLPHLHSQSFAGIELLREGRDGWHARIELVVPDLSATPTDSEIAELPAHRDAVAEAGSSSASLDPSEALSAAGGIAGLDASVEAAFTGVGYSQVVTTSGPASTAATTPPDDRESTFEASGSDASLGAQGSSSQVRSAVGASSTVAPPSVVVSAEVEVRLDRPGFRYVTRTVAGVGEGTEILTELQPVGERATGIRVSFAVPGVSAQDADLVGAYYRDLYAELWDQDEAMMETRQAVLDGRKARRNDPQMDSFGLVPVSLGPASELKARLPLLVEVAGRTFRVAEHRGDPVVYSAVCPHLGGPLGDPGRGDGPDAEGCVTCPWHGYRFDVHTGRSADGRRLRMQEVPRVVTNKRNGHAELVWN